MQVRTTMRYHFIPINMVIIKKKEQIISVAEDVEKLELLCIPGGKAKWYSHCGKQHGSFSKN